MDKEWARFSTGQFVQQVLPSSLPPSGGGSISLPSSPHYPLSPYSPLLAYSSQERQLSPSFLLPNRQSPNSTSSPNHVLIDRLSNQPSPNPYLRHPPHSFPTSNSFPDYKYSTGDLRRLSVSCSPSTSPFAGGSGSSSPLPGHPSRAWPPSPTAYLDSDKSRLSFHKTYDGQEALRHLAQQKLWHKQSPTTPEASLRLGFSGSPMSLSPAIPKRPTPKSTPSPGFSPKSTPSPSFSHSVAARAMPNHHISASPVASHPLTPNSVTHLSLGATAIPLSKSMMPPHPLTPVSLSTHPYNPSSVSHPHVNGLYERRLEIKPELGASRLNGMYGGNGPQMPPEVGFTSYKETGELKGNMETAAVDHHGIRESQKVFIDYQGQNIDHFSKPLPCQMSSQPRLARPQEMPRTDSKLQNGQYQQCYQGAENNTDGNYTNAESIPPKACSQSGIAFAKSSAPSLQSKKQSGRDSPRKYPDVLSREREQQILADIQKRFSLPGEPWCAKKVQAKASNEIVVKKNGPGDQKFLERDSDQMRLSQSQHSKHAGLSQQQTILSQSPNSSQLMATSQTSSQFHQGVTVSAAANHHMRFAQPQPHRPQMPTSHSEAAVSHRQQMPTSHSEAAVNGIPLQSQQQSHIFNSTPKQQLQQPHIYPPKQDGAAEKPKPKKRKKKVIEDKEKPEEKPNDSLNKHTPSSMDPLLAKYPIYSQIMSSFIEDSSKSGLSSPYSSLKKTVEESTDEKEPIKTKKKKKSIGLLKSDVSVSSVDPIKHKSPEKSCAENLLPSITGFTLLQRDSKASSQELGYNLQTYNSVLCKLQDQLLRISDPEHKTENVDNKNLILPSSHSLNMSGDQRESESACSVNSSSTSGYGLGNNKSAIFRTDIHFGDKCIENKDNVKVSEFLKSTTLGHCAHTPSTSMCCDTCHKVGKQDSYLCSSHKVLPSTELNCDSQPPAFQDKSCLNSVKIEGDNPLCDSFKPVDPHSFISPSQPDMLPYPPGHFRDVEFKTDEQDRLDRLKSNTKIEVPVCNCFGSDYQYNEAVEGPFYTHLGAASSLVAVRHIMEDRFKLVGQSIRIEKVRYTGKEGKSSKGCPIAKWILRRSGPEEKVMCIVKHRAGHSCPSAYIIVAIVAWEGVPAQMADDMYDYMVKSLTNNGFETDRRCGTNDAKTCACQGWDLDQRGASFSFGCSWSMYFNGCKFARSLNARKFKLKDTSMEGVLEDHFQKLATHVGPLYKQSAPESYNNQIAFENAGAECRLGYEPGRPFTGVTTCMDFCAHAHKDLHNMNNGSTVVVTLTKNRGFNKPDDEQLHVLPLYVLDSTDEFDSTEGLYQRVRNGSLEVLNNYPMEARTRAYPLTPKKKGKGKKDSPAKKEKEKLKAAKNAEIALQLQYQKMQHLQYQRHQSLGEKLQNDSQGFPPNNISSAPGLGPGEIRPPNMPQPGQPLYEAFWKYFENYGAFPPQELSSEQKEAMAGAVHNTHNNPAEHLKNGLPEFPHKRANGMFSPGQQVQGHADFTPQNYPYRPNSMNIGESLGPSPNKKPMLSEQTNYQVDNSPLHLLSEAVSIRSRDMEGEAQGSRRFNQHVPGNNQHTPGNDLHASGNNPHASGNNPHASGNNPHVPGNNPHAPGNNPHALGNNPHTFGNNPHAPGNNPYAPGNNPHAPGNNPHALGNNPHTFGNNPHAPGNNPHAPGNNPHALGNNPHTFGNNPHAPGNNPHAPGNNPHALGNNPHAPGNNPHALGNNPHAPGNNPHAPGHNPHALGNNSHAPGNNPHALGNYPLASGNNPYVPINNRHAPENNPHAPGINPHAPGNNLHAPGNNPHAPKPHLNDQWNNMKLEESSQMRTYPNQSAKINGLPLNHQLNDMNFNFGADSRPDCVDGCMRDPSFLSADMEYNEDSFLDPEIGGVAVALTHGSVYFEVAKRELHATTALRKPDRRDPTRISMVFYQHKNMNLRLHGYYENEQKIEMQKQKREQMLAETGLAQESSKPGPKKKPKKDTEDFSQTSAAKYKYMLECPMGQTETLTTDSIIVRWIDSQPMVTGPYQRWVSH